MIVPRHMKSMVEKRKHRCSDAVVLNIISPKFHRKINQYIAIIADKKIRNRMKK